MIARRMCVVLLAATLPWPGSVRTVSAQSDVWTTHGPDGGEITTLASDPRAPATLYAGSNGVFKSIDGGGQWVNLGLRDTGVRDLAIDPQTPDTVYAGTGRGVFKSTDGGASWSAVNTGLTDDTDVYALAIDPQNSATLYAGTIDGLFKSTDGGAGWSLIKTWPTSVVLALAIDPQAPATVYAGLSRDGVAKSTDSGVSWNDMGLTGETIRDLVIDPNASSTLYAAAGDGIYKSTDAGTSWTLGNTGLNASYHWALVIDPEVPAILYTGTEYGVFKSTDGGTSWSAANSGLTPIGILALAIDRQTPATVYAGTMFPSPPGGLGCGCDWNKDIGVFKTTDRGGHWIPVSRGLIATGAGPVVIDPQTPSTLYAGSRGIIKSTDAGGSWSNVSTGLTHPGISSLAIDSQTPTTIYAASNGIFKSTDGGGSWAAANTGLGNFPSVNTLAIDPQVPSTLYVGTNIHGLGLARSTDGAGSWSVLDIGLGDRAVVSSLTIDPQVPTTLYAGAYDGAGTFGGGTFKTTDGGASWSVVNPLRLIVAVDPRTSTTLYAANYQYSLGEGVFKSTDGGASWSAVNTGLTNLQVRALAIDPQTPTTLYAGTNGGGVFKSTDGGASWNDFNQGLTNSTINALAIDAIMLVAGTDAGVFTIAFAPAFVLTVGTTGDGAGIVTSSPPGITCGTACAQSYSSGTMVTLMAAPASRSVFTGWSGCDSVDGTTCFVTMNAAASVTARFDLERFTLTARTSGLGRGTVTSDPAGIACGADCSEAFVSGTTVTLTARAALGSIFTGWSGCDAVSSGRCTVTMNAGRSVTATFLGLPLGTAPVIRFER